jgi:peroxin-4
MISTARRLQKELAALVNNPDENILLTPNEDNISEWTATVKAPIGSFYEGFEFDLLISVPSNYPMVPPNIKFVTKIFHPNILFSVSGCELRLTMSDDHLNQYYQTGEICLDILKKEWSPAWSIQSACRAIIALLTDPAPDR